MVGHPFIAAWTQDVELLIKESATVHALCGCGYRREVDLQRLLRERGPRFSLWNRTPPCPAPGCRQRVHFYAVRPGGSWKLNLWGVPPRMVEPIHDRWHATLPKQERDKFPAARLMTATGGKLEVSCPVCSWAYTFESKLDVESWGFGVTIDRLRKLLRSQCGRATCVREVDLVVPGEGR